MTKNTKDLVSQLLVILTLASVTLNHQCSENCYRCFGPRDCGACYKRKVLKFSRVTGYVCSSQQAPASEHCLVYTPNGCVKCSPGWASNLSNGFKCVKSTIKNCVYEDVLDSKHICYSCLEGYPNKNRSSCIPASQVKKAIPNCKLGGISINQREPICIQCVAGYVSGQQSCYKTLPSLKGCLFTDRNVCQICDAQNGYFMRDNAK